MEQRESSTGEAKTKEPETKLCDYCFASIDFRATRCRFCSSHLVSTKLSTEDRKSFSVVREDLNVGGNKSLSKMYIVVKDSALKQALRNIIGNNEAFFEAEPKIGSDLVIILKFHSNDAGINIVVVCFHSITARLYSK